MVPPKPCSVNAAVFQYRVRLSRLKPFASNLGIRDAAIGTCIARTLIHASAAPERKRRTMLKRFATVFAFIFVLPVVSAAQNPRSQNPSPGDTREFRFDTQLGVAVARQSHVCLLIRNDELKRGTPFYLIRADEPQSLKRATVLPPHAKSCQGIVVAPDSQLHAYELKLGKNSRLIPWQPVIAVFGFTGKPKTVERQVIADLDGDGVEEYFRSCSGLEGINLSVWSGKPPQARKRWQQYYYLGYDIKPTCTDTEPRDAPQSHH
ncbi:MAG TPA: hypothetical protein VJ731_11285 [Terriglobales bacterium]|nr:hypothetical protein [Terriglobales bacterium]